jgi:TRAP-type C4-dicarboxylate transport system substrate-binding protein
MKFYEVGPYISQTRHAITVRPLAFSGKTLRRLPADLQAAILRAGKEAGEFGRDLESTEDRKRLERLAKEGKVKLVEFADREQLRTLTEPVRRTYAKDVGAEAVYARIEAIN